MKIIGTNGDPGATVWPMTTKMIAMPFAMSIHLSRRGVLSGICGVCSLRCFASCIFKPFS